MKINNPNNLPVVDYRVAKPLQGDLKKLTDKNYQKLKGVLERRGFDAPLFLWKSGDDLYLMDGHQRQKVMLGEDMNDDGSYEVPYILIEAASELEAKAKLLELTSQYGTITKKGFEDFSVDLPQAELLEAVHFDALPFTNREADPDVEEDQPPEPEGGGAASVAGEIYQLGRHRLMCADASAFGDMSELMNGQLGDMVFTDPPYNVDYKGMQNSKQWDPIANDAMDPKEFTDFLKVVFTNIAQATKDGAAFYICHADKSHREFREAFEDAGYDWRATIIWAKNTPAFNFAQYKYKHEPIFYCYKKDKAVAWFGDRTQHTIWSFDKEMGEHPTIKPVTLIAKAILNSSKEGDIVLDFFGGSGSTLIACEQLNRTCYMMEIDPKYCDVIRRRYQKLTTGKEDGWQEATSVPSLVEA